MKKFYEEIPWSVFQATAVQHFGFQFKGIDVFFHRKDVIAATDGPVVRISPDEKCDDVKLIKYIEV